ETDFYADHWLHDGGTVPGAPDWQVLHTPGHTDESTSYYNARTRVLLSGDAVLAHGGRPLFTPEVVDASDAEQTRERLLSLDVDHVLPGHGRPVSRPEVLTTAWPS
ncbi:MAG: MBL fold metallo-hydrolase, partial [Actinomycetota bacterium]